MRYDAGTRPSAGASVVSPAGVLTRTFHHLRSQWDADDRRAHSASSSSSTKTSTSSATVSSSSWPASAHVGATYSTLRIGGCATQLSRSFAAHAHCWPRRRIRPCTAGAWRGRVDARAQATLTLGASSWGAVKPSIVTARAGAPGPPALARLEQALRGTREALGEVTRERRGPRSTRLAAACSARPPLVSASSAHAAARVPAADALIRPRTSRRPARAIPARWQRVTSAIRACRACLVIRRSAARATSV